MQTKAHAVDVAQYILDKLPGDVSTIKLQKLVYYAKAWSLVWDEDPLFPERVEAWANGPVVPSLFALHRGQFFAPKSILGANTENLTQDQKETIDIVLDSYGEKSPQYLVALSHSERPWIDARGDCPAGQRCTAEITDASIAEYYSGLK